MFKNHTYKIPVIPVSLLLFMLSLCSSSFGQDDRKYIRKGNREYEKNKYDESEVLYRKAAAENDKSPDAGFNVGDALYKQEKYEDAVRQFAENAERTENKEKQSAAWYNLGNSLLSTRQLEQSIEAYKNSLKLNPENLQAKYNLGYAQDLLEEQQQQQQQQQENQENQQQQSQNNQQQQQDQQDNGDQEQDQQQPQENGLSKEDAERLLNALANDEREVQEKVQREKAARSRTRVLKNW